MSSFTADVLGEIGLPVPIKELAAQKWDVIVVGAGHNGLACEAYLARAGQGVLVIERRARGGRACTMEGAVAGGGQAGRVLAAGAAFFFWPFGDLKASEPDGHVAKPCQRVTVVIRSCTSRT